MDESTAMVPNEETEDRDDASSSLPPMTPLSKFEAVELCLFFLGNGGRILPGSSVRSLW